jgi:hypothetical protein
MVTTTDFFSAAGFAAGFAPDLSFAASSGFFSSGAKVT